MVIRIEAGSKNVYGIEKSLINGKLFLKWNASGLNDFLILSGPAKTDVLITDAEKDRFADLLNQLQHELFREKKAQIKESGLSAYLISLNELRRDGGLPINNEPAYFAVYGIGVVQNEAVVYYDSNPHVGNVYSLTVDVMVHDEPYIIEKRSLFKRTSEYSGYHKVTVSSPYPNLVGGILKYHVGGFLYSFPDEVVKNGGSFFVQCGQTPGLHFESSNPGIIIK